MLKSVASVRERHDALNKIAIEFVRHVLAQNPEATTFVEIYDAMSRTACARSFHNLGHDELAKTGISFSLLDTRKLERIIVKARQMPNK